MSDRRITINSLEHFVVGVLAFPAALFGGMVATGIWNSTYWIFDHPFYTYLYADQPKQSALTDNMWWVAFWTGFCLTAGVVSAMCLHRKSLACFVGFLFAIAFAAVAIAAIALLNATAPNGFKG